MPAPFPRRVSCGRLLTGRRPGTRPSRKSKVNMPLSFTAHTPVTLLLMCPLASSPVLSKGVGAADAAAPVRALRAVKHVRLQRRLFRLDKQARLRSGARGMQARKALVAFEKVVAQSSST